MNARNILKTKLCNCLNLKIWKIANDILLNTLETMTQDYINGLSA